MKMTQHNYAVETFVTERFDQYKNWYDINASKSKKKYLQMRCFSVVAGLMVPILINIPDDYVIFGASIVKIIVPIISVSVSAAVALEGILHYREQWKNYRSTEQYLGHEIVAFKAGLGPYKAMDPNSAFKLFVERVEDAIKSENAATLNIMTKGHEPLDEKSSKSGDKERSTEPKAQESEDKTHK